MILVERLTSASLSSSAIDYHFFKRCEGIAVNESRTASHAIAGRDLNGRMLLLVCQLGTNPGCHEASSFKVGPRENPCGRT